MAQGPRRGRSRPRSCSLSVCTLCLSVLTWPCSLLLLECTMLWLPHQRITRTQCAGGDDEARTLLGVAARLGELGVHVTVLAVERLRALAVEVAHAPRFLALE